MWLCGKEVEVEEEVDFCGRDEAAAKREFLLSRTQDPALDKSRGLPCSIHLPRGDTGNESASRKCDYDFELSSALACIK